MIKSVEKAKGFVSDYSYQIFIFVAFIAIYLITLYPGEGGRINYGDSIKWQYLHLANGLPHGTGYPQFLVLTEIFSRVVFFLEGPERITFISALFGALSMSVFYSLVFLLTKDKVGSLISAFFVGLSYTFWAQATEAEVYTLNIFYLLSVFYLFIKFYQTKESKYYLLGCAVYALSFGNHLSMITILPAVAFIVLITDYKVVFVPKHLLLVALFLVIGALQYGFILNRAFSVNHPYMEISPNPSMTEFLGYITGNHKSQMFVFSYEEIIFDRFPVLLHFLNENFTVLGLVFAAAGFFYYFYIRKSYVILSFISLAMLGQVVFNISYNVGDLLVFFIPVYVIIGIFAGLLFSASKDVLPKAILSLLTVYLIVHNTQSKDILAKNDYSLLFRPMLSLYQEQPDDLPLYYKSKDYNMETFMFYNNLSGDLGGSKSLVPFTSLIQTDSFYVAYENDYHEDLAAEYDLKVASVEQIHDFVRKRIHSPDHVLFFSVTDEAAQNIPHEFGALLKQYGSKVESLAYRGSYAAMLYNGKIVESMDLAGPAQIKSDNFEIDPLEGKIDYEVFSAGWGFGSTSVVKINGFDYSGKERGMNIVVYDVAKNKVVDIANFDTHAGYPKTLFKAIKRKPELLSTAQ